MLLLIHPWFQSGDMQKTKVNEFITISLPASFERLSASEINQKFLSANQPIAVYGDASRTVDLSINTSFSRWREEDIALMMSFYKSTIMGLYDEVQFNKEGIEEINGRKFVVFEFVSSITADAEDIINTRSISKYTYIQYTIVNFKTVLFHFTCPARARGLWTDTAAEIMGSVKVSNKF
jgi:hypothetical protein